MNGVIYCRVSSKEQVEGTSLDSQEAACREYAGRGGITVVKVFVERGESAKFADRTELLEMMEYCKEKQNGVEALLVWKVDRLARNVGDHFNIKANLLKHGIRVISVTEPIDAKPEGKLLETILAGFAQFDNDLRAARTLQGMKKRIQEGLFPWKPPLGYKTVNQPGSKKTQPDQPDQPTFGLLQRVWEEFATGAHTKAEILRLATTWGLKAKSGAPLSKQSLDNTFSDPFYAGIIREPWSGEEYVGRHLPMVSRETFFCVQEIIARRNRALRHVRLHPDLPLRMFVRCVGCKHYLTGSFSRGRSRHYGYYHCFNAACPCATYRRTRDLHEEFTVFLNSVAPARVDIDFVTDQLLAAAQDRERASRLLAQRHKAELLKLQDQQQQLINMRMQGLITDEEFTIQKAMLVKRRSEPERHPADPLYDKENIRKQLDNIYEPLVNPVATWTTLPPMLKQRFQRFVLPAGFVAGEIGTAELGRLFSVFRHRKGNESTLVALEGEFWNQLVREIKAFAAIFHRAEAQ